MRVGVDIRDLKIAQTGQKTFIEELSRSFKKMNGQQNVLFIFLQPIIPAYTGKNKIFKALEHINLQMWKQVFLPIKAWFNRCDILFCHDYYVPIIHPGFKTVPVFHDAFFFEYPEHYNRYWLRTFKLLALTAAKRSAFVVVPTDHARLTITTHTGIDPQKIRVIYEGPKSFEVDTANNWSITSPYLLHVGVLEKRKNLPFLIEVFKKIKTQFPDLKLVLVGKGSGKMNSDDTENVMRSIKINELQNDVILTGYVPDNELPSIYKNALLYIFPSYNEGFGIPILEAFKYKVPVMVANNSSLPEVGGDAVVCFDPFNKDDLYTKMQVLLSNEDLRNQLIRKGVERSRIFSWDRAALELINQFKDLCNGRS